MDSFFDAFTGTLHGKDAGVKNTSNTTAAVIQMVSGSAPFYTSLKLLFL